MENIDDIPIGNSEPDDPSKYEVVEENLTVTQKTVGLFLAKKQIKYNIAVLSYLTTDEQPLDEYMSQIVDFLSKSNPQVQLLSLSLLKKHFESPNKDEFKPRKKALKLILKHCITSAKEDLKTIATECFVLISNIIEQESLMEILAESIEAKGPKQAAAGCFAAGVICKEFGPAKVNPQNLAQIVIKALSIGTKALKTEALETLKIMISYFGPLIEKEIKTIPSHAAEEIQQFISERAGKLEKPINAILGFSTNDLIPEVVFCLK